MTREIRSALIVCTRRIGDVLLATPLVRSLKAANPQMAVDILVFQGTEYIVSSCPDIHRVWTVNERSDLKAHLALLRSLWRNYDLSLSVLAGDRPTFYAWVAGRHRVGTLLTDRKSWWKRWLLDEWVPFDNLTTHTIAMNLRLLEPLGMKPLSSPIVSWRQEDEEAVRRLFTGFDGPQQFAVMHVSPKFVYKAWTTQGWAVLGQWLAERKLKVVVTGGLSSAEETYARDVAESSSGTWLNLAGRIGLPSMAALLNRAAVYIGTDTAVSHMAAAVGTPTVVLFGPSNPVKWGPWPKDFQVSSPSPWRSRGSQRQGNVFLLQGEGDCVPCLGEGCDRHINSMSDCLQALPAQRVIEAAQTMMLEQTDVGLIAGIPSSQIGSSRV